jgi:phosphoserine phosphatase
VTSPAKIELLNTIQNIDLAQWLPIESDSVGISIEFDENLQAFKRTASKNNTDAIIIPSKQKVELVVFSDLDMASFATLLTLCKIQTCQLQAVNHRNSATSYRFVVQVQDLKHAREEMAAFNTAKQIESALLSNAPELAIPGLLVMDMDSTTIKIECIDEIAALAGVGEEVAAVTELAMLGQLDFGQSLHQRVGKLAGSSEDILADVAKNIPLMEGLETLIAELKKHQWRIAIASGGFTYFADHLKDMLSLDAAMANVLEIKHKKLTGKVLGDVIDAQAKADCLVKLQKEFDIAAKQTVAMGDGANDLVMMDAAHLGVAFHAKPLVLAQADTCITTTGLDCLLHWLA